jgi:exosortase/archaeosortase family protein
VAEACSGLGMLFTFLALATAVAFVIDRPPRDKIILVASALPIALLANVVRVTATGVLHVTAGDAAAKAFFHDLAGWVMMPLALGVLWLELVVLSRLFVAAERPAPVFAAEAA